jgi:large conductance mechanosensitive channel
VDLSVTVGSAVVKYGSFIQTVVDFLVIAFVIFLIVKAANSMKKPAPAPAPAAPTIKDCPHCFTAIPIKATRCPNCTSELK